MSLRLSQAAVELSDLPSVFLLAMSNKTLLTLEPGTRVVDWVKPAVGTDSYWGRNAPVWNNKGDTVKLTDEAGDGIDTCSYGGSRKTAGLRGVGAIWWTTKHKRLNLCIGALYRAGEKGLREPIRSYPR
jgi:hypothetical protein